MTRYEVGTSFDWLTPNLQHQYRQEGYIQMPNYGVMDSYYQIGDSWQRQKISNERYVLKSFEKEKSRGLDPDFHWFRVQERWKIEREAYNERRRRVKVVADFLHSGEEERITMACVLVNWNFSITRIYNVIEQMGWQQGTR